MKKAILLSLVLVSLFSATAFGAEGFPTSLAGFHLGAMVEEYKDFFEYDKGLPVSDAPFLSENLLKEDALPGIRGGSLAYGNCLVKGKLVRVKLKFHDRSQGFYKKLKARYIDQFGKPDQYMGDAFKNVIAWKWVFEKDGEKISLVLMWSRDKEIRPGVSIKMTNDTLMDKEMECYRETVMHKGMGKGMSTKVHSLDLYVPK